MTTISRPVLAGFFDTFAHALGADRDPDEPDPFYAGEIPAGGLSTLDAARLTLAGYTPSRYRLDKEYKPYEVQVAGLLRSGLLKRFESSGYAFCATCRKMADTLEGLTSLIQDEGRVASGESLRDWLRIDLDDPASLEEWESTADYDDASEYLTGPLIADISSDVTLLRQMADTVEAGLKPGGDPKVRALADTLIKVIAEAERDASLRAAAALSPDPAEKESRDRDDRKVLVFSYFADTIYYLQDNIDLILDSDPALSRLQGPGGVRHGHRSAAAPGTAGRPAPSPRTRPSPGSPPGPADRRTSTAARPPRIATTCCSRPMCSRRVSTSSRRTTSSTTTCRGTRCAWSSGTGASTGSGPGTTTCTSGASSPTSAWTGCSTSNASCTAS